MTDDALRRLNDSLSEIRDQEVEAMTGNERVKREYTEWAYSVAYPAIQRIQKSLEANRADGVVTKLVEPKGLTPTFGIRVAYPSSDQPPFTYLFFLHRNTGDVRAFVMKLQTVANLDYGMPGEQGKDRATDEELVFWNEHEGDPFNHAPDITADHIISDFSDAFIAHRKHQWPKPPDRQHSGPGKQAIPEAYFNQKRGLPPRRG